MARWKCGLDRQAQATAWSSDGADLAYAAYRGVVSLVVFDLAEGAYDTGFAGVDGGVGGGANVEFTKGVELDVDGVGWGALGNSLDFLGL